ncbi:MAG: hypothetical protein QM820_59130 [Minicystis sp.]
MSPEDEPTTRSSIPIAWILVGIVGVGLVAAGVLGALFLLVFVPKPAPPPSVAAPAPPGVTPPGATTTAPEVDRDSDTNTDEPDTAPPSSTVLRPSGAEPKSFGPFRLVFHVQTGRWTNQVVITPWGDVVAIGSSTARLFARDTGAELLAVPVCFTQSVDGAAFIDDHRMLLACGEEVQEISFPQGHRRTVHKFSPRVEHTAIGGRRIAAGVDGFWTKNNNTVTVLSVDGFRVVDTFDAGSKIEGIAISDDGQRVAVGIDGSDIVLRDVAAKETRRLTQSQRHRHSALHFSPDGSHLFAETESFKGGEIDLASGAIRGAFDTSSWLRAMRYAGKAGVLATGASGLALFRGTSKVTPSPIDDLGEGLDLSADGTFACAAGRGGDVACFSTKPVEPSTFVPAPSKGKGGR